MTSRRAALLSLAATYLFFFEYLPPFKRVHLPFDLEGFHYPLLNYGFQALREGRFPEWDPSIYCGLSLAGNFQAGLWYPPNWVLFLANLPRGGLAYKSLEVLVIWHVWLAFFLCWGWLRRRADALPSALGAAVFACSGYMMSQLQHYGVIAAWAWLPLALRAVDERSWWKLSAASALALLAGYPPAWFTFCTLTAVYAAATAARRLGAVLAGLAFSLGLAAVQVLPALEAAALKTPEEKYGGGIQGAEFYLSFFLPNYFNLGRSGSAPGEPTAQYFYLGAPVLFGLAWTACRRLFRRQLAALAIAGVSLVLMTNPLGLVEAGVRRVPHLTELCRDWNFLAGLPLAAALITAQAVQDFLGWRNGGTRARTAFRAPVTALSLAWCARQILVWLPGGSEFRAGWGSVWDPAVTLGLFSLLLFTVRSPAAVLLLAAVDYKVFGTDRRFNAAAFDADVFFGDARNTGRREFRGLDDRVYAILLAEPAHRVALDQGTLHPTELRHYRLATPQGFDPLLPAAYKRAIEAFAPFGTDRLFWIDPSNAGLLDRTAVRYYLTSVHSPAHAALAASSDFRLVEPAESYFRVYEYRHAQPAARWEHGEGAAKIRLWTAERREVAVRSASGGRFVLIEQFFPGWTAAIDGRPAEIERWGGAFQSVAVPPGEHRIQFEFRSRGLRAGALISCFCIGLLGWMARRTP